MNTFVVDWQVPFWATAAADPQGNAMTVNNAPFESTNYAVGRIQSAFQKVSTGIWEVPGAKYDATYTLAGQTINFDADGKATAVVPETGANGETVANTREVKLDARATSSTLPPAHRARRHRHARGVQRRGQGGEAAALVHVRPRGLRRPHRSDQRLQRAERRVLHRPRELRPVRHRRDRDYWFGEDDIDEVFGGSADYNTADEQTWIQIGEKSGYAISDKKNEVIDDGFLTGAYEGYQVRQIRWVVKAVPVREVNGTTVADVNDDTLSTKVAVPHASAWIPTRCPTTPVT